MMNQGQASFKQSRIEKVVNAICIYLMIAEAGLCLLVAIYSGFYQSRYASTDASGVHRKAEYIFYTATTVNIDDSSIVYSPSVTGLITFFSYFILLNTIIPISLIVSLEFVKLIQTLFIVHDAEMYDPETCKQAKCLSMTLHEELASIKYVFADKTGTLTSNVM